MTSDVGYGLSHMLIGYLYIFFCEVYVHIFACFLIGALVFFLFFFFFAQPGEQWHNHGSL